LLAGVRESQALPVVLAIGAIAVQLLLVFVLFGCRQAQTRCRA
jgi:hypothetical protein